jgi:cysteinyl-tRNA synthetase
MLKIYNTLTRKKQAFKPRKGKKVNLFVCGPTVYDYSHLGHARTYIVFDMIARYLETKGFSVFYLQNITDIDDKIIQRARERRTTPQALARIFEKEYFQDIKKGLKINSVTEYARATGHIKEIIGQIKRLVRKGFAYRIEDGIYYDISKFKDYGKLSRRTVSGAEDGVSRIDESKGKRNKGDFCLWKFSRADEPSWPSIWGEGRPGWHIEDTAIAEKYFGFQYDIHGGARDLMFPHHEAEIAQMEAISGKKPFVKYWLHSGFLTVKGQKMAKSLGNFITIRDFLKENSGRCLRLLVIKNHYRSPLDYNEKMLGQAKKELARIDEFVAKIKNLSLPKTKSALRISDYEKSFEKSMADDFNTPQAMAAIFELINKGNSLISENKLTRSDTKDILEFLKKIDRIFNFIFRPKSKDKIPGELLGLAKQRQEYREQGLWQKADELREKIKKLGYWVEDTEKGPQIKKI